MWVHDEPVDGGYKSIYMILIHEIHVFVSFRSSNTCISCSNITYIGLYPSSTGLQHNDQLPVGLIAQLVKHCTGIAKVGVRIPFRLNFSGLSRYYISSVKKLRRSNTPTSFQSAVQIRPLRMSASYIKKYFVSCFQREGVQ